MKTNFYVILSFLLFSPVRLSFQLKRSGIAVFNRYAKGEPAEPKPIQCPCLPAW